MADTALEGLTAVTAVTYDDLLYLLDGAANSRKITIQNAFKLTVNAQTGTTYTLALADGGNVVTMSNASANTLTIPTNASVAFPTGTIILVYQLGAGATTITADTGVTLNGISAGSGTMNTQYGGVSLLKIGTDTWVAGNGTLGLVA